MLYLVVNVLAEVDKLKKNQYDLVEVPTFGSTLLSSISILKRHFYVIKDPTLDDWLETWVHFRLKLGMDGVLRWGANDDVEVSTINTHPYAL